ncbi:glucose-1-phosphate adenylyltransferase family protein [Nocardioides aestuarii]|uniref:Glucose-1-phosphate adenylyltransferase family protein n=1 Tax=Nocardioides aestuarii TaxID=252231 RepID=A0ABW4TU43_9ACTN
MPGTRVLAVVQAGGQGNRLDVLTRERAKPTLPVAGVYQLLDFALSNLSNSGISDVWLSVQFHGSDLEARVSNGRPWDLDRTHGGLRLLMPDEGTGGSDEEGFARGNADELFRVRDQLRAADPEVVLVMSADHVYRLDLGEVVHHHLAHGLECTVVTTEVALEDAGDHTVVEVDGGRVTAVHHKPDHPPGGTIAAEVIAYAPDALVAVLEELHRELGADAGPGDSGLGDFAEHLLPRMVERGRAGAFALAGYWRDLGQPHYYLRAHRELLLDDHGVLNDRTWPIMTKDPQRGPARLLDGAEVVDSLVSPGCVVEGLVERSVLGPGVRVAPGARVVDAVLMDDVTVGERAVVARAIVAERCSILADARLGHLDADLEDSGAIAVVGRESQVEQGAELAAGARLEPGSS